MFGRVSCTTSIGSAKFSYFQEEGGEGRGFKALAALRCSLDLLSLVKVRCVLEILVGGEGEDGDGDCDNSG